MSDDVFGLNSSDLFDFNNIIWGNWFPIFLSVDILSLVLGFPTNLYVIWLIGSGTGNVLASEFFSLNLSVCEMLVCLNTLLFWTSESFDLSMVTYYGQGLTITGRPLFQCLICVERYLAVVHPVTFLKSKPLRYRLICCVFAWTAVFASCGTIALVFSLRIIEFFSFIYSFTLAQLFFFLFLQLFCCLAVLRALKQSGPGEKAREKQEENHMKRRAFKVILIITVTMVIIYIPSIISSFFFLCSAQDSSVLSVIVKYSYLLGGLVQPFLFLHRVGKLHFTKCQ